MRIAYWDLETSDLEGDVGRILCASILSLPSGTMTTFRNDKVKKKRSMADDAEIARKIRDKLEEHHLTVGWFSKGFDIAFLNTRLVASKQRPLASLLHIDGCWSLKGWRGLKPRNAKLATAAEFFGVPERKMPVDVSVWIDAALGGDRKAMDVLVERCESDVRVTRDVTEQLLNANLIKTIQRYP